MQGDWVRQTTLNSIRVCLINAYIKLERKIELDFIF